MFRTKVSEPEYFIYLPIKGKSINISIFRLDLFDLKITILTHINGTNITMLNIEIIISLIILIPILIISLMANIIMALAIHKISKKNFDILYKIGITKMYFEGKWNENKIINDLIQANDALRSQNNILEKKYNKLSFNSLILSIITLVIIKLTNRKKLK